MKEGSGRAADGPPPDAAAVKEVSQWFVRRIRQGNGQAVQKKQTPKWAANRQDPDEHEIDPEQEHLAPAPVPVCQESILGAGRSFHVFEPPPRRQVLDDIPEKPPQAKVPDATQGLFDLD